MIDPIVTLLTIVPGASVAAATVTSQHPAATHVV